MTFIPTNRTINTIILNAIFLTKITSLKLKVYKRKIIYSRKNKNRKQEY